MYLQGLQGQIDAFKELNVRWVVLADEPADKLAEMKQRHGLDIPFVLDPGGEVGKAWNLLYTPDQHDGHLEPGIFVLSPDGVQRTGSYSTGPFGRMAVEHVLKQTTMMAKAAKG
jgi:peroxiredoxin